MTEVKIKTSPADEIVKFIQEHRKEINEMGWGHIVVKVFRYDIELISVNKDYKPD